jgi:hypothetical protein
MHRFCTAWCMACRSGSNWVNFAHPSSMDQGRCMGKKAKVWGKAAAAADWPEARPASSTTRNSTRCSRARFEMAHRRPSLGQYEQRLAIQIWRLYRSVMSRKISDRRTGALINPADPKGSFASMITITVSDSSALPGISRQKSPTIKAHRRLG